jgi:hypothetical protein
VLRSQVWYSMREQQGDQMYFEKNRPN